RLRSRGSPAGRSLAPHPGRRDPSAFPVGRLCRRDRGRRGRDDRGDEGGVQGDRLDRRVAHAAPPPQLRRRRRLPLPPLLPPLLSADFPPPALPVAGVRRQGVVRRRGRRRIRRRRRRRLLRRRRLVWRRRVFGELVAMRHFFSKLDSNRIVAAIAEAEKRSSGEIRVHVTRHKPGNLEERAKRRFELLGMTKTAHRNGVLLYIAPKLRRFQILGDTGIHEKCGDDFWKETAAEI